MNKECLNFGHALEALKLDKKIARAGWNGNGMYLVFVAGGITNHPSIENSKDIEALPWIGMKTADNKFVPWLASQSDLLADDWQVIEGLC